MKAEEATVDTIRVLLVDDHAMMRESLAAALLLGIRRQ